MFKNLIVYRITPGWNASVADMEDALAPAVFVECGASQQQSAGWVPPRGQAHGALVESVAGQRIVKLQIETRAVPASVVRRKAEDEAAHIEATTGRKPGKKQMKELREDALLALLPQAFTRQSAVLVWIDADAGLLLTDAGTQARADLVTTELIKGLPGLSLSLLQTAESPQTMMTRWLNAESPAEWPANWSVERECELKSADEEKSVVRFTRHNLQNDEVRQHIAQGKLPTRLALSWNGRVALVLTEGLQLKKISFLEGVMDETAASGDDRFDADVAISTGELGKLLPELIEALGGELAMGAPASTAPPA